MDYVNILIPFLGGLGMFIYGMQIMADGLENAAGNKMKSLLEALTKNKFFGVCLGAFITAVIQSSSATTVMVVGFVNAGIMNLTQAIGVIMGANIGTTVTGWLVSSAEWADFLSPTTLAPLVIMIGVVIMLTAKRKTSKYISNIAIGFGLLFVGISTMSSAVSPLRESEAFVDMFVALGTNPLLGILAGAFVTAIIQSSSASVGILQSLAAAGLVPFSAAVYIIMGQNIGTCVTAMLSSIGAKKNAKTAALMHLLFNIIGSVIFSVIAIVYFMVINKTMGAGMISQTEISIVHTLFNIGTTVLLFPASGWIVKMAKKLNKAEDEGLEENVAHLDDRMLQTPSIALQTTVKEIIRMGTLVIETIDTTKEVLFTRNHGYISGIKEKEKVVDKLAAEITDYTIKLGSLQITEKEHEEVARLLSVVTDIKRISDYCENVAEYAQSLKENGIAFTDEGTEELREMLDVCADSFIYAIKALEGLDKEMALKVIEKETEADGLEIHLRTKHIKRLANNQCNTQAGIVFLDTLICLERISDHSRNIAEEVLENLA
ncbi:MAG: Na/Pi cotransporter family protein [Eubacteriales bacterium]